MKKIIILKAHEWNRVTKMLIKIAFVGVCVCFVLFFLFFQEKNFFFLVWNPVKKQFQKRKMISRQKLNVMCESWKKKKVRLRQDSFFVILNPFKYWQQIIISHIPYRNLDITVTLYTLLKHNRYVLCLVCKNAWQSLNESYKKQKNKLLLLQHFSLNFTH